MSQSSAVQHLMKQNTMSLILRCISDYIFGYHRPEYSYISLPENDKIICNGISELRECVKIMMLNNIDFIEIEEIKINRDENGNTHIGTYKVVKKGGYSNHISINIIDPDDKNFRDWHINMI